MGSLLAARTADSVRKNGLVAQGALVFGATMVMNVCGFVFQAIASRKLSVADYGTLYALTAVAAIVASPATMLTPVIARFAAEFEALQDQAHLRGLFFGIMRGAGIAGIVYLAIALVFARSLSGFFHAPVPAIVLVGIVTAISLNSVILRAIVQGTQNFLDYFASMSADGIGRVIALYIFLTAGFGLTGGLMGFGVGLACGLVCVLFVLVRRYRAVPEQPVQYDWRRIFLTIGGAASLAVGMTLMGNADVVLVKHFFPPHDAGLYSAAALGGKILLFAAGFIPTVLLPQATERHTRGERTSKVLLAACAALAIIAAVGLLGFKLYGVLLLHVLTGTKYDAAIGLLVWYGGAMAFLALTNALASYGIATHRLAFAIPLLAGTLGTFVAIIFVHPTLLAVIQLLLVGNALTAAVTALCLALQAVRRLFA